MACSKSPSTLCSKAAASVLSKSGNATCSAAIRDSNTCWEWESSPTFSKAATTDCEKRWKKTLIANFSYFHDDLVSSPAVAEQRALVARKRQQNLMFWMHRHHQQPHQWCRFAHWLFVCRPLVVWPVPRPHAMTTSSWAPPCSVWTCTRRTSVSPRRPETPPQTQIEHASLRAKINRKLNTDSPRYLQYQRHTRQSTTLATARRRQTLFRSWQSLPRPDDTPWPSSSAFATAWCTNEGARHDWRKVETKQHRQYPVQRAKSTKLHACLCRYLIFWTIAVVFVVVLAIGGNGRAELYRGAKQFKLSSKRPRSLPRQGVTTWKHSLVALTIPSRITFNSSSVAWKRLTNSGCKKS